MNTTQCPRLGLEPGLLDPESTALTMRPLRLPTYSLRRKRFGGVWEQRKTEERDFRCFSRTKNGARAKKRKRGVGEVWFLARYRFYQILLKWSLLIANSKQRFYKLLLQNWLIFQTKQFRNICNLNPQNKHPTTSHDYNAIQKLRQDYDYCSKWA